jgi:hypothetical protein
MSLVTITPTGKPTWSRQAAIGDYGGDPNKEDSESEGNSPYAWWVYRGIMAARGSAYSQQVGGTLVHCETLALARMKAWKCFRIPEQFRANCLPGSSDYALPYWIKVLGIPSKPSDQPWELRRRAAVHYRAVSDISLEGIQDALEELLGDMFIDASYATGASLSAPPYLTYWPGVNPGPDSYSLGGGAWLSERSHLWVQLDRPAGMTDAEFFQLANVQLFQLLDRMLPAYCTFAWSIGTGFLLDISQLDFGGLSPS